MKCNGTNRYRAIRAKLDTIEIWGQRIFLLMVILAAVMTVLVPNDRAFADEGNLGDGFETNILGIFGDLAKTAITVMYGLMIILFAVGTVKSGLGAQAAQSFGATGRVSIEMLNLFGGVVIFIFGLLTLPLANMIIDNVYKELFAGGTVGISQPNIPIK